MMLALRRFILPIIAISLVATALRAADDDEKPAKPEKADAKSETPAPKKLDIKKILSHLEGEYKAKLASPDWRVRALAVVSLARLPQPEVTTKLFQVMDNDRNDIVRLLAWQAILSRVADFKPPEHAKWVQSTYGMAEKGLFRGRMRVALIDVISTAPMNARSKRIFETIAAETNAWEMHDIPVLNALGQCLGKWHSASIAEGLIKAMSTENFAYRAEYILQKAGCPVKTAMTRLPPSAFEPMNPERSHMDSKHMWELTQADYAAWIAREKRASWKEITSMPDEPWKQLKPLHLSAPVTMEEASSNESLWRADFELPKADVKAFEVCFVVDATGSMAEALAWLARDVHTMARALSACSLEPRIGITFYRDVGDEFVTRSVPLTAKMDDLAKALETIGASGGGADIDEAVLDGLQEAINKNRWSSRQAGGKVIVLVGDAPPHDKDMQKCIDLAAKAKENGFKIYAVKVATNYGKNDLESFDKIAEAGGGPSVEASFQWKKKYTFLDAKGKEIPLKTIARPEAQTVIVDAPITEHPGEIVLTQILADAIRPQYRDRLAPIVKTLIAYAEPPTPKEERIGFPADTPPTSKGTLKAQDK